MPGVRTVGVQAMPPSAGAGAPQKLRILMLHSFRTSAEIFQIQMKRSGLDAALADSLEMVYVDGPLKATGPLPDDVEPYFPATSFDHREWWSFETDEHGDHYYQGFDKSVSYVEGLLRERAPVHGICGFSQGATLAALLVSNQERGRMLQDVARLRFCMFFGAPLSRLQEHRAAYERTIACPSIHVIGEKDTLKPFSDKLASCFQDPLIIRHGRGHVIPQLPPIDVEQIRMFLRQLQTAAPSTASL